MIFLEDKFTKFMVLIIAILMVYSCANEQEKVNEGLNDLIFSGTTITYVDKECKSLLQISTIRDGTMADSVTFIYLDDIMVKRHYDHLNRLYQIDSVWHNKDVRKTIYSDIVNRASWTVYEYLDTNSNILRMIKIYDDNYDTLRFEYDSLQNVIQMKSNSGQSDNYKYLYENGRVKKKFFYNEKSGKILQMEAYYYRNDKLIKKELLNSVDEIYEYVTYEYNELSCLTRTNFYELKREP